MLVSVTRLNDFLKNDCWQMLLQKKTKRLATFWATLKNLAFKQKLLWLLIGQLLGKIGHCFIAASGHTGVGSSLHR